MIPFKLPSLKTIGIIAIILLILYAWGATQYALSQKNKKEIAETEREQAIKFATIEKESTAIYINKYRQQVGRTKAIELSLSNVQKLRNTERLAFLKQFESLKKNLNNLESAASFDFTMMGDSVPVIIEKVPCSDTLKAFRYTIHDEYNHISALVLDTPVFEVRVPIRAAIYWERKNKFLFWRVGKKEYSIESYSPNKLIRIEGQQLYKVARKEAK